MSEMNEATLESRLHAVLTKVFPWISPGEIKHQVVFSVNLGRNTFKVDGSAASELAHPRLDILLMYKNKNLAVLELKAPSEKLTENDEKQGKSNVQQDMQGIVIGATPFNRDQKEISPI